MRKQWGLLAVFFGVALVASVFGSNFLSGYNLENLTNRTALFSILALGAGIVIAVGGIDLSIGSVVCLCGIATPSLLVEHGWPAWQVVPVVLGMAAAIGLMHGLLITKLRLQPFLVTLCGLLLYRGLARWVTGDQSQGFAGEFDGLRSLALGRIPVPFIEGYRIPATVIPLAVLAVGTSLVLTRTVWGRWLLATGSNESAARISGVPTQRLTIAAYVACSLLAGLGGMLFIFDIGSAQPSDFGNFYELYAIAAAVLGGCSLRGGRASVGGIVLGTATLQVLRNAIILLGLSSQLEFAVIGAVLLLGMTADELLLRWRERRAERRAPSG